jgi:GH25 family lysozyme M1 (1,4-beta-N-acetylmuramidase)
MAREARMLFGLYHFIRPGNISGQVDNFLEVYNRYDPTTLLVALDYEDAGVSLDDCAAWLGVVEDQIGKKPVIYSGHVLKEKLGDQVHPVLNGTNYPLWLAQYSSTPTLPAGWKQYWLWQYSDKGEVPGVDPPTDVNAGEKSRVTEFWSGSVDFVPTPETSDKYRQALEDIREIATRALEGE